MKYVSIDEKSDIEGSLKIGINFDYEVRGFKGILGGWSNFDRETHREFIHWEGLSWPGCA